MNKKDHYVFKEGIQRLKDFPYNVKGKHFKMIFSFNNNEINPLVIVENVDDPEESYCYPERYFQRCRQRKKRREANE